jgi:predicted permease
MLGNTVLIGLAIAPLFVSDQALALVVFYSIIHLLAPEFFVIKC